MKNLKFILLTLIVSLLFSSQGFAQTYIFQNNLKLVAQGTSTAANTQLSLVDGTAFAYLVGVDLSAYQTGKHLLMVYNASTGLLIGQGYCSVTPPAGETLGETECVTGGDFSNSADWTAEAGWSVADGKASASSITGKSIYQAHSYAAGGLFKSVVTVDSITGGYIYGTIAGYVLAAYTSTGTKTTYLTSLGGSRSRLAGTLTAIQIDDWSIKQVLDPPSTGVRIVSAKSGATQNWLVKGAGAVNSAISYKVYYIGD